MTGFPVTVGLAPGDEKVTSLQKHRALGTRGVTPDGRVFYWAENGATALNAQMVIQSAVSYGGSAHQAALDVVGAVTTGKTTITVTLATTEAGENLYADGYLSIDTSPGRGMYQIDSHPAITSVGSGVITLKESDPLRDALTSGTTKVGLHRSIYGAAIAMPTTATGGAIGVVNCEVAASGTEVSGIFPNPVYFWVQTYGPTLVKTDAALVAGRNVIVPGASVGNVTTQTTAAADIAEQVIGTSPTIGAGDEKFNYIFLTIRA